MQNKPSEKKTTIAGPLYLICLLGASLYFYFFHASMTAGARALAILVVAAVAWLGLWVIVDFIIRTHRTSK